MSPAKPSRWASTWTCAVSSPWSLEGRVVADVDGGAVPAVADERAGRVHAASGEHRAGLDLDVGRRKAQRAPRRTPRTTLPPAAAGGRGSRARPRAARRGASRRMRVELIGRPPRCTRASDHGLEAVRARRRRASVAGVPRPPAPKLKLLAHDDDRGVEAAREDVAQKLLGGQARPAPRRRAARRARRRPARRSARASERRRRQQARLARGSRTRQRVVVEGERRST